MQRKRKKKEKPEQLQANVYQQNVKLSVIWIGQYNKIPRDIAEGNADEERGKQIDREKSVQNINWKWEFDWMTKSKIIESVKNIYIYVLPCDSNRRTTINQSLLWLIFVNIC